VVCITHIRAEFYEDSDWIGKIDPYVELEADSMLIHRTEVLEECGQNPQWKMELEIEVTDHQSFELKTVFKDKDVIGSDYLGTARFSIGQLSEYIT
jgi:Ca2+-dependent lipid-binding protein